MNRVHGLLGCAGGLAIALAVAGCSNETEADRAAARAAMHVDGAQLIAEGQRDVDDGKAMQARGQSMKDHGDNAAGEDMWQRGQVKIDQGNSKIQHGRDLGSK